MPKVIKYSPNKKYDWDNFITNSDIQCFLFYRNYLEYHKERFDDYSLILLNMDKIVAVLPGNISGSSFYSHQGISFGSMLCKQNTSYTNRSNYFEHFIIYLKNHQFQQLVIKNAPFFYSPNLQLSNQLLIESSYSPAINIEAGTYLFCQNHSFPKRCVRTGKLNMYRLEETEDIDSFWSILTNSLEQRHNSQPVHSKLEMKILKELFKTNITVFHLKEISTGEIHGGTIVYFSKDVAKIQYFAISTNGLKNRASDVLYYMLISNLKRKVSFIDFGTNMSNNRINSSLLSSKEKFGIVSFPVHTYSINLS